MRSTILNHCLGHAHATLTKHPQHAHYMHWSYIVQDQRVVEWGMNRDHTPALHFGYGPNAKLHSELVAYKKARGLLANGPFNVVNIRLNRQGQVKLSAPCLVCQQWLASVGCEKVWFSLPGGWAKLILHKT